MLIQIASARPGIETTRLRTLGAASKRGDQNRSEVRRGTVVSPDWQLDVPNFLREIPKGDRIVLESMSKVVDLRDRPSPSFVFAVID